MRTGIAFPSRAATRCLEKGYGRAWPHHRRPTDSLEHEGPRVCSLRDSGPGSPHRLGSLLRRRGAMLKWFMASKRVRTASTTVPPAVDWAGIDTRRVEHSAGTGIFAQGDAATSVMYIE